MDVRWGAWATHNAQMVCVCADAWKALRSRTTPVDDAHPSCLTGRVDVESKKETALALATTINSKRANLKAIEDQIAALERQRRRVQQEIEAHEAEFAQLLQTSGSSSITGRIVDILESRPNSSFPAEWIATAVGSANLRSIRTLLYRLEKGGRIKKDEAGLYSAR